MFNFLQKGGREREGKEEKKDSAAQIKISVLLSYLSGNLKAMNFPILREKKWHNSQSDIS
jgi:hypothetical protein